MRKQYFEEKSYTVEEVWECEWWKLYKTDVRKRHLWESFPYERPIHQDHLLDKIKSGALFGYVHCDIKVEEHLREQFANLPQIFQNANVCRQYSGLLLQEYAKNQELLFQPRQKLISSFELNNTKINTPLQLF